MAEDLLSGFTVCLFGRVLEDIELVKGKDRKHGPGRNLLAKAMADEDARLARIYAFSFQSELFLLTRPAAFLVHGDGDKADAERLITAELTLPKDLRAWPYNRDDMTLRLDILTGTFDSLLLEHELGRDGLHDYVRGGCDVGAPTAARPAGFRGGRRWRASEDD